MSDSGNTPPWTALFGLLSLTLLFLFSSCFLVLGFFFFLASSSWLLLFVLLGVAASTSFLFLVKDMWSN
jgi:hypothetical protein